MYRYRNFKCLLMIGLLGGIGACGITTDITQLISVQMTGVSEQPAGASGSDSPVFQQYTLTNIQAEIKETGDIVSFFSGENPIVSKIVSRPQIIYSRDISDYSTVTFRALSVRFSPNVKGGTGKKNDYVVSLSNPLITLGEEITIREGRNLVVYVAVQWKNTINTATEVMNEPTIIIKSSK